jgi:hypothetical protein
MHQSDFGGLVSSRQLRSEIDLEKEMLIVVTELKIFSFWSKVTPDACTDSKSEN